jgi:hypothetical protein
LRTVSLVVVSVAVVVAALLLARPAPAQIFPPHPCEAFTPCTTVAGPWVSNAQGNGNMWTVSCTGQSAVAVGSDVVFKGAVQPAGIDVAGGLGPGGDSLTFELFVPLTYHGLINWQPAIGCSPLGTPFSPVGRAAGFRRSVRRLVRSVPVRPGVDVRQRLACGRGERLVRSGSGVGFFTRRPPSGRVLRAIEHRHRRAGRVAWTLVSAPEGVGDDERVEVQTTVLCARARAAQVPYPDPRPCVGFTACTTMLGPWVTSPAGGGDAWNVSCPTGRYAEGADAVFDDYAVRWVGAQTNSNLGPGFGDVLTFGAFPGQPQIKYRPGVGCIAQGATAGEAAFQRSAGLARRIRTVVKRVRIRPGADLRVRLACRPAERLMNSGSGVGFYTRRPPSDDTVAALAHRHRRSGKVTRTVATGPPGVGDDERVELHVVLQCEL